jgi:hypothetical protein
LSFQKVFDTMLGMATSSKEMYSIAGRLQGMLAENETSVVDVLGLGRTIGHIFQTSAGDVFVGRYQGSDKQGALVWGSPDAVLKGTYTALYVDPYTMTEPFVNLYGAKDKHIQKGILDWSKESQVLEPLFSSHL